MHDWKLDFKWLEVRHYIKTAFSYKALPEMETILLLIGIQEYGIIQKDFSKEEKRDLMHIAVCRLLEKEGLYEYSGRDQDGWPHWSKVRHIPAMDLEKQEHLLKEKIIEYFGISDQKNN